jgi:hypothetical protein
VCIQDPSFMWNSPDWSLLSSLVQYKLLFTSLSNLRKKRRTVSRKRKTIITIALEQERSQEQENKLSTLDDTLDKIQYRIDETKIELAKGKYSR